MRLSRLLLAGVTSSLLGTSPAVLASGLDYNYLEASYLRGNADDDAPSGEHRGFEVTLSAPLEDGNFMRVRYARSKAETDDATQTRISGGLGSHAAWNAMIDGYMLLSYEEYKFRGQDEDGYSGELGLRFGLSEILELSAAGQYLKLGKLGESVTWTGGLILELGRGVALSARYENAEGEARYTAGLRFYSR